MLPANDLQQLIDTVRATFSCSPNLEICLEANPEDLSVEVLDDFVALGIERLSIGIQSFDDDVLKSMNRSHNAQQSKEAIELAHQAGIKRLSVDLIYGRPTGGQDDFSKDLEQFVSLPVDHISAYALTIEPRTVYAQMHKKGELQLPDDEVIEQQFTQLLSTLASHGFEQYEVSNFSKPGFESRHNTAYWQGIPYLGIGPSAHSFDGEQRYWNIANNHRYVQAVENGLVTWEFEKLTRDMRYNEYVLTRSRTKWGLDLNHVKETFDIDILHDFRAELSKYVGRYSIFDGHLCLNQQGLLIADGFAADLFLVD